MRFLERELTERNIDDENFNKIHNSFGKVWNYYEFLGILLITWNERCQLSERVCQPNVVIGETEFGGNSPVETFRNTNNRIVNPDFEINVNPTTRVRVPIRGNFKNFLGNSRFIPYTSSDLKAAKETLDAFKSYYSA